MKIFSWGPNSKGQHGSGDYEDYSSPNCISLSFNICEIKSIICGLTYSFIITKNGLLYACGNNFNGQIGLEEIDNVSTFMQIKNIFTIRVATIATGWDFSVILTEMGELYSSGDNKHCQLGLENENVKMISKFTKIDLPPMTAIKAGLWHVIALSKNNEIWTWGYNHKAQLGIWPKSRSGFMPGCRKIENEEEISFVVAGAYHSGFMTKSYHMVMWGDNQYGQCGFSDKDDETLVKPRKMQSSLVNIIQLECGWSHCLARDVDGVCYSWGQNTYSQLGRVLENNSNYDPVPYSVNYFINHQIKIKEISCGCQHNLAVDTNNSLWSWGWNDHGILGMGDFVDRVVPEKVSKLPSSIESISHGGSQSFAVVS